MNRMAYILGIDQGHSATRAVVCRDDGVILGTGIAPGACHSTHGMDQAMRSITIAATNARGAAGLAAEEFDILACGLTGADWEDEYALLHSTVSKLGLSKRVVIKNDSIIALKGGTFSLYGAVIIAGTGGNCAVISPEGDEFVYHYYHDNYLQGGIALGRRALDSIYRSATGRMSATALTQLVLDQYAFTTVDELLRADCENRLGSTSSIAPLVFRAAYEGDYPSSQIIESFGVGLAELATAALAQFDMTSLDVEIVLSGGIFKAVGSLLDEVIAANIHMVVPRARIVNARYEPVAGAAVLGLQELDIEFTEDIRNRFENSCEKHELIRVRTKSEMWEEGEP